MIFFFTVITKLVAVLEILENMSKYATKNMSFNLSENSCPSEVFKNIFITVTRTKEKNLCVKPLRFLQWPALLSLKLFNLSPI